MRRTKLFQIVYILVWVLFGSQCFAQAISSSDLINNVKQYNGKVLTYRGEVVGDIMIRGKHAWLNINDGYIAIGVWTSKESVKDIKYVGNYRTKGDFIEVTGIFKRSCPEHGGDLDIHARNITKIISGGILSKETNMNKVYIAFLLFIITSLAYLLSRLAPHKKF